MGKLQTAEHRKSGINISLDAETLAVLDGAAERAGITRSALVRRMIREWAEDEAEDRQLAEQASAVLANPESEWVPWASAPGPTRSGPKGR